MSKPYTGARKTMLTLAVSLTLTSLAGAVQAQDQKLIAQTDLPQVPLEVTDPKRKPVSGDDSGAAPGKDQETVKQQRKAREQRRQVAQGIREQSKEVAPNSTDEAIEEAKQAALGKGGERENQKVVAEPGLNEIAQISKGHINRIIVPFNNPEIRTTSNEAEISAKGSVIYVTTNSSRPVTLFVTPESNDGVAISLTLAPKTIAPQQVDVELDSHYQSEIIQASPKARDWEERTPYVDTLTSVFKALAKNDLPQGYTLREPRPREEASPCSVDPDKGDVSFETAQVVEGHNITVDVVVALNEGARPVEVVGTQCSGDRVMGAAEWPRSILEPGQKTEVFVARQRLDEREKQNRRPSTIQE